MIVFCTYCSRQKSAEAGNVPAIRRYQSERIAKVHRVTQEVGVQFLILSGEFGLLRPELNMDSKELCHRMPNE